MSPCVRCGTDNPGHARFCLGCGAPIADAEPDERTGLRRLYVVLTRAVSRLTVVHARPLPGALGADPGPLTGDPDGESANLRGPLVTAAGSAAAPSAS